MMSGKFLARASAFSLTLFLAACGGGDGSSSLAGGDNGDSNPDNVGSIQLIASPTQIGSSANSQSELTALVKGNDGVLLEGIEVSFSANNNGTLQVERATTDESGTATALLSPAGDPRNRSITVEAETARLKDTVDIQVTGTGLAIAGPSTVALGDSASYRIQLTDSDGNGLADQTVSVSSNISQIESSSLTTDANGTVDINLTAVGSGNDTLSVNAFSGESAISASKSIGISSDQFTFVRPASDSEVNLNTPQTVTLEWLVDGNPVANGTQVRFSTTRGTLTPNSGNALISNGRASVTVQAANAGPATLTAIDPASGLSTELDIEFVATTPDSLNLQATQVQVGLNESTEIVATVRDAENNLVKNQEVSFLILEDGSNGHLENSFDTTDSQGKARAIYTGGGSGSGRDGVKIQAAVGGNIEATVTLTVAKQGLRLAIGTGNEMEEPDPVRYIKPYIAIVTDANGSPVEGAEVELSILPTAYRKGTWVKGSDAWVRDIKTLPPHCLAEDSNRNGVLDEGEDNNDNGSLEPTNSATTTLSQVATGADGTANFGLIYPQSHCTWVEVELTATVRVEGTESVEKSKFFLSCLASDLTDLDVTPPGGTEGLYGTTSSCSTLD